MYHLYLFCQEKGQAKFDKKRRELKVTLPIIALEPKPAAGTMPRPAAGDIIKQDPASLRDVPTASESLPHPTIESAKAAEVTKADGVPPVAARAAESGSLEDPQPASAVAGRPVIKLACTQELDRMVVRLDGLREEAAPRALLNSSSYGPVEVHGVDVHVAGSVYRIR